MKKLKIFPKMFIQIFSVLGIIIILVHSLVFFIFPKTYLETRKEKIYNIANEISSNMNGKEIKYIQQTLELYSKSSEIKAFIKEENNKNEIQIKDNINVNLESDSNSLIIEEREITLNDGKKINLQFVSTADMQKDAKDLSIKFLPYSLLISILFSAVISLIYAKLIKNNLQEIKAKQQLKEETITKEHEIRQRLSIEKNKAETLITDKYTNAIFNCTMKLDNAENLRLTQEEKDNLLTLLEQLKKERGENVALIEQQYNLKVADELMKWRAQREQELGINVQKIQQIDVQNSLERQQAEQKREAQYLQDRLQMLQARKKDSERLIILLHTKENEINLLKRNILKDIASKAMKIAIQKHLKLVIADVPATLDFFGNIKIDNFDDTVLNGMVVGADAIDITDDVMAELTNEQMQNNNGK